MSPASMGLPSCFKTRLHTQSSSLGSPLGLYIWTRPVFRSAASTSRTSVLGPNYERLYVSHPTQEVRKMGLMHHGCRHKVQSDWSRPEFLSLGTWDWPRFLTMDRCPNRYGAIRQLGLKHISHSHPIDRGDTLIALLLPNWNFLTHSDIFAESPKRVGFRPGGGLCKLAYRFLERGR